MNKRSLVVIPLFILFTATILWLWFPPSGLNKAPDIKLTTTNGTTIDLQQLRGKPVLVTFWATSCAGCVREIPHLIKLYEKFADCGFKIIGIAMPYDPPNQVVNMITERDISYPIAIDIEGNAVLAFGNVFVTPTSFLIAPDGTIAKHTIGEMNMNELHKTIISMLSKENKSRIKVSDIHHIPATSS